MCADCECSAAGWTGVFCDGDGAVSNMKKAIWARPIDRKFEKSAGES